MATKFLIIYSTTDGQTLKICTRLKALLQQEGKNASLLDVTDVKERDLLAVDKLVIGASIRYGKHNKAVYQLIRNYRKTIDGMPNAFFSVNLVARKPEKARVDTNPYLKRFLREVGYQPTRVTVFAGKLDYQRYNVLDRLIIRLIMHLTGGPTDPLACVEYTDWGKIDEFGRSVCEM